jgi:hypothetical protein
MRFGDAIYFAPTLSEGELNYVITRIVMAWARKDKNYARLNAAHGTFFSAAAEFYRREVAPYEDEKAKKNGDVYADA